MAYLFGKGPVYEPNHGSFVIFLLCTSLASLIIITFGIPTSLHVRWLVANCADERGQIDRQKYIQTDRQTDRQRDIQTDRQTD